MSKDKPLKCTLCYERHALIEAMFRFLQKQHSYIYFDGKEIKEKSCFNCVKFTYDCPYVDRPLFVPCDFYGDK